MARIIAVCGKICCGKTCYANSIKEKENAVILSCDELTKALFDNKLGEKHDEMTLKIRGYFMNKSVELVRAGCNVILDWGFWSAEDRKTTTGFFRSRNIPCEWHYIDTDDRTWQMNIAERNSRVMSGLGGSDYFLDDGLMEKMLSKWEAPSEDEIDVRYILRRHG